jgi:hypothetical protein
MSGVGSRTISGVPSRFFSLPSAATFGRKSATAALITMTSWSAAATCIASSISAAVSTATTSTPLGTGNDTVDTSVTLAPRDAASAATA